MVENYKTPDFRPFVEYFLGGWLMVFDDIWMMFDDDVCSSYLKSNDYLCKSHEFWRSTSTISGSSWFMHSGKAVYLQPSAFRRPSSLLPVCRLQKAFLSKMSLCKSRACIKAMLA